MTERIRITHPRTAAAPSLPPRPPSREIDELTAIGELYLEALLRSQRRIAIIISAGAIALLLALGLVLAEVSGLTRITVFGIQLPWVLVGMAVYPLLMGIGLIAVRLAERTDREFAGLMRQR